MTSIKLLEDRLDELEKQVYGFGKVLQLDDSFPETSITDNLLHANTLISSALSGRENIAEAIKRLPELIKYLDISPDELDEPIQIKSLLLLLPEQEIMDNYKYLSKIQELMPVLETDSLKDLPELSVKLKELSLKQLKIHDEAEAFAKDMHAIFSVYNDVIDSISKTLITLDQEITRAELKESRK
ncbi:PREDICTED: uncharacterized protein LOC107063664 [Polistes dominula]|uniref:Uncharacterized protein LOC107063664 n=1 Tax=Polistes dominula TaxID=743375 RepID=A0ABM1HSZ9_POLDO|nr:PREDICTED: uncharacterized protein LOC107063664 [Polistes dominula]XP_015171096.1 PREDICTED: uncharacterized protein LOC107063664 [Polistes dominula]XP_015171107.1 PREDICTED: uncharacterized protein LOC107063664 [Polistes dominula]